MLLDIILQRYGVWGVRCEVWGMRYGGKGGRHPAAGGRGATGLLPSVEEELVQRGQGRLG